jgi:hypothetical protein
MILQEYLHQEEQGEQVVASWWRRLREITSDMVVPVVYMLLSVTMSLPSIATPQWLASYLLFAPAFVQSLYGFMMIPWVCT